jgi:hypothetical protein
MAVMKRAVFCLSVAYVSTTSEIQVARFS